MIKRLLFVLILPIFSIGSTNQSEVYQGSRHSSKNKLIKQAFERGRKPNEFYVIRNEGGKSIKVEKMREDIQKEGYIAGSYTTKSVTRFGDVSSSLSTMQFLPKDEYESYLFYNLDNDWSTKFEQLNQTGSAYCYNGTSSLGSYFTKCDNIRWSGEVKNGYLNGAGVGMAKLNDYKMVYFKAVFDMGVPIGDNTFKWYDLNGNYDPYSSSRVSSHTSNVGKFYDNLADIKVNNKYGFISRDAKTAIPVEFNSVVSYFSNGRATVTNDKEEIIIDRTGKQVDLSARQKKIYADIKAEEDRKAEAARQAELAKERERLLAEQRAAEEKRQAEAKEADLKRRIEVNKNTKLWSRGCRLAYRYPNGYEYVLATLEEWNENRSKVKVKIVASPSSTRTLNGDLLEKNNTMWVSAHNEGWHLALDEEITAALNNDNSVKKETVVTSSSSSSGSGYSTCSTCRGAGMIKCTNCYGKGYVEATWSDEVSTCSTCGGRGRAVCYSCNGTGKR